MSVFSLQWVKVVSGRLGVVAMATTHPLHAVLVCVCVDMSLFTCVYTHVCCRVVSVCTHAGCSCIVCIHVWFILYVCVCRVCSSVCVHDMYSTCVYNTALSVPKHMMSCHSHLSALLHPGKKTKWWDTTFALLIDKNTEQCFNSLQTHKDTGSILLWTFYWGEPERAPLWRGV